MQTTLVLSLRDRPHLKSKWVRTRPEQTINKRATPRTIVHQSSLLLAKMGLWAQLSSKKLWSKSTIARRLSLSQLRELFWTARRAHLLFWLQVNLLRSDSSTIAVKMLKVVFSKSTRRHSPSKVQKLPNSKKRNQRLLRPCHTLANPVQSYRTTSASFNLISTLYPTSSLFPSSKRLQSFRNLANSGLIGKPKECCSSHLSPLARVLSQG